MKSRSIFNCFFIALILFGIWGLAEENRTGKFTDPRDHNVYQWVKIGNQVWMAENLRFKTEKGSWCWKNLEENCKTRGRLYNWDAAMKAVPPGWHLPSDEEWKKLEITLGLTKDQADREGFRIDGENLLAGKIKQKGSWPETYKGKTLIITNESGFSAIQTGIYANGSFNHDPYSIWWTSSGSETHSWLRHIGFFDNSIGRVMNRKVFAFSVRCIKDQSMISLNIHEAARQGDLEQVKTMLKEGKDRPWGIYWVNAGIIEKLRPENL